MSVVGSGQVSGTPDILRVTFGVEQVAPDVAAAVATVGERTDAVIAALRAQGVQESQLGTSSVNVFQEYREPGTDPAYRASHTVLVETKDLTGFGALLNAAVDAVGNSLALHGLQFDIEDKTDLLIQARELAFQQAKTKAAHLAGLAGFSLGSVTAISENNAHTPLGGPEIRMSASKAYDSAINIVPDEQNVVVSLQVHFAWA
ncbi:SIMPL domain-containing protein [Kribbella speibonae]|uniref:SIMPL domain-containing protein n=1 Tax=Kribbella speibonae TaxID=1572660 RepID=UPI001EDE7868|nr:SIMPL domain-containing protein [Kribbella speibonae]